MESVERKYPAIHKIAALSKLLAWLIAICGLSAIVVVSTLPINELLKFLAAVMIALIFGLIYFSILAGAELLLAVARIEINTQQRPTFLPQSEGPGTSPQKTTTY